MKEKENTKDNREKVIILDTSAFVAGFNPFSVKERQYIVPKIKEEMKKK